MQKALLALFNIDSETKEHEQEFILKDIVINFHHSFEVLFKFLVSMKNQYLLYNNQEEIFKYQVNVLKSKTRKDMENKKQNEKIEVKTIKFLDALNRVIILYNVEIDNNLYSQFEKLNKLRNALTHHECELDQSEIEFIIACTLPFIAKIFNEHRGSLEELISDKQNKQLKQLIEKRYIWRFTTIIKLLEEGLNGNKDELVHLGYDSWDYYNEEDFLLQKFEELIFSRFNGEILTDLQKNHEFNSWLIEKKKILIDNAIRVLQKKVTIALSFILDESCLNIEEIRNDKSIAFIKPTFTNYKMITKIVLAECVKTINSLIDSLKLLVPCDELINKKLSYFIERVEESSARISGTEIELEFSFKDYIKICDKSLKAGKWLIDKDEDDKYSLIRKGIETSKYEDFYEKVDDEVCFGEISYELIGKSIMGSIGTVDKIDQCESFVQFIIKDQSNEINRTYQIILLSSVSVETYVDHGFFDSGSIDIYVGAKITINQQNQIAGVTDINLIGLCIDDIFPPL